MIKYKYEKITIDLNGGMRVNALSTNTTRPDEQVAIEQVFNPSTSIEAIDAAISATANTIWGLQT